MLGFKNLNEMYWYLLADIDSEGLEVSSRGSNQKEKIYVQCGFNDPTDLQILYPSRKFNQEYAMTEWLWYCSLDRNVKNIGKLASLWKRISDDKNEVESNYGPYFFDPIKQQHFQGSQWEWVKEELINDPDSRRASIVINQPHHKGKNPQDVPCTQYVQFFIRENKLHIGVSMRSNDIVFGLTNDAFTFSLFQQMMYNELKIKMPDLKLGSYNHFAGSMHLYEMHYDMAAKILSEQDYISNDTSRKFKLKENVTWNVMMKEITPKSPLIKDSSKEEIIEYVKEKEKELFE